MKKKKLCMDFFYQEHFIIIVCILDKKLLSVKKVFMDVSFLPDHSKHSRGPVQACECSIAY